MPISRTLHFKSALLGAKWADNVRLSLDGEGVIRSIAENVELTKADTCYSGTAIPGMANLHSHAFQRAMAGLAETWNPDGDSFWGWRTVMYRFLETLTPDDVLAIAAQLYSEMLAAGYTSVGEFHYLHNAPDGNPYENPTAMSEAIFKAHAQTGIALTHLPVLYQTSGFGDETINEGQKRFFHSNEDYLSLLDRLSGLCGKRGDDVQLGMAFHSLRAVPEGNLRHITAEFRNRFGDAPIHIHIAEQDAEVVDCLITNNKRPVQLLLDTGLVDKNWCFIHATHLNDAEIKGMAEVGAIAGLCPTTEGNLGDGFFPAEKFLWQGGIIGVGSDSHVSVDAAEELRLLEYGVRLANERRGCLGNAESPSVGTNLWVKAASGGAKALGRKAGVIEKGYKADIVILDGDTAITTGRGRDNLLNSFIFSNQNPGSRSPISQVLVSGHPALKPDQKPEDNKIYQNYKKTMAKLMESA